MLKKMQRPLVLFTILHKSDATIVKSVLYYDVHLVAGKMFVGRHF